MTMSQKCLDDIFDMKIEVPTGCSFVYFFCLTGPLRFGCVAQLLIAMWVFSHMVIMETYFVWWALGCPWPHVVSIRLGCFDVFLFRQPQFLVTVGSAGVWKFLTCSFLSYHPHLLFFLTSSILFLQSGQFSAFHDCPQARMFRSIWMVFIQGAHTQIYTPGVFWPARHSVSN